MGEPESLKYSEEHEWIDVDDDTVTIGITEFAQESLGDVVYVELPENGTHVLKNESIGSIESVKAVSDLFSPVTGEVVEVNDDLAESPDALNTDPYEKGWLIKVRINDTNELDELMDYEGYNEFIR